LGQYGWQNQRRISTISQAVNAKRSVYERLKVENSQLDTKLERLPSLDLRVPQVAAALRLISQTIPEDVALTNIDVEEKEGEGGLEVRLSGLIYGRQEEAFPTVTKFMEDLQKAPIFSNVQLGHAGDGEAPRPAVLAFEIGCVLR
jgi:Tfp pilus assembly protein PilN